MINKRSHLETLTQDLSQEISRHLETKDIINLTKSNKYLGLLFQKPLQARIKEILITKIISYAAYHRQDEVRNILFNQPNLLEDKIFMNKLLFHHIMFGQQKEAEMILIHQPELLQINGTATDYSNRTFENINVIQYPIWAKDTLMLSMLLFYLLPQHNGLDLAQKIFFGHAKEGISYTKIVNSEKMTVKNEQFFDFSQIIKSLDSYIKEFSDYEECKKQWSKVGMAQRDLVTHVAQHYCNPGESAYTYNKRNLEFFDWLKKMDSYWFPLSISLGTEGAIVHSSVNPYLRPRICKTCSTEPAVRDLADLKQLWEVKSNDLIAIQLYLEDSTNNPLPKHLQHHSELNEEESYYYTRPKIFSALNHE